MGQVVAFYLNNGFCTATYSAFDQVSPTDNDAYGITVLTSYSTTLATQNVCTNRPSYSSFGLQGVRHDSCPTPDSEFYQSNPLLGPYCKPPAQPAPAPDKQNGCPWCDSHGNGSNSGGANAGSGSTIKGDPIDAGNGNTHQEEVDYAGVGTNPIKFVRSYNSVDYQCLPTTGAGGQYIGGGWSATYFQILVPVTITDSTTTYNTVHAYRPDGRILIFNEYNGVYSPDGDVSDSLIQTANGWQYQTANDTIETYNSAGQLLSVAARGQAPITVSYASGSAAGDPPTSVSDAFGHSLQFSYTANAAKKRVLTSITDPAGHTVSYNSDTYGRLNSVTQTDNTTRSYTYVATNYCELTKLTDEASVQYASWTYDSYNHANSFQNSGGVNAYSIANHTSGSGGSVTVTDPLGEQRTYNQSLIWGTYRTTSSSAACPGCSEDAGRVYDASGNMTSRTDFDGNQTNYVYNAQTNLETSRTEAYGTSTARTITTAWDSSWRQPDTITEPSRTTAFSYDSMGNVLTKIVTDTTVTPNVSRTWTYTYDSYGRMLTAQGPRTDVNSTTTYAYYTCTTGYQCGQLHTVTDPVGNVTTYNTYNAHGQPLTFTDPNGVVTTLTYDAGSGLRRGR